MSMIAPPHLRREHDVDTRHQPIDIDGPNETGKNKKDGRKRTTSDCAERLMSGWGWVFDLLTVLISLTDVVSDLVVAVQFWRAERYVWFWLVISSLILSNCLYTIFTVEVLVRKEDWLGPRVSKWYRPVQYSLLFPLAQLLPSLRWLKEQIYSSEEKRKTMTHIPDAADQRWDFVLEEDGNQFVKEEIDALGNVDLMRRLDKALERHLKTHVLFYIETVVESIPQSVIQMLAISFMGEASTWQVVSMSLSIASIVSKGYVISRSPVISIVFFKFLLGAHDVFSLFYIFSTLVSQYRPLEMPLFGTELYVSYLSGIWIYGVVIVGLAGALAWILAGICNIHNHLEMGHRVTLEMVGKVLGLCAISVVAAPPLAIAATAMQLIWVVLTIKSHEPVESAFPTIARLYSFIARGLGEEWNNRIFFIMSKQHKYATEMRWGTTSDASPKMKAAYEAMDTLLQRKPFKSRYLAQHSLRYGMTWGVPSHDTGPGRVLKVYASVVLALYTLLQSYTGVFAFVSMGLYWNQQNTLQWVFFVGKCVPAVLGLFFLPWVYPYVVFLIETKFLILRTRGQAENVREWIREYHKPPHWAVIKHCVPTELLPSDVIEYAIKFITPEQIDLRSLTVADCHRLKLVAREVEEGRDHDVPFPEAGSDSDEDSPPPAVAPATATARKLPPADASTTTSAAVSLSQPRSFSASDDDLELV